MILPMELLVGGLVARGLAMMSGYLTPLAPHNGNAGICAPGGHTKSLRATLVLLVIRSHPVHVRARTTPAISVTVCRLRLPFHQVPRSRSPDVGTAFRGLPMITNQRA